MGFAKAAVWSRVVQRAEIVVQHQPRGPGGCVQGADLRRIFHPRLIGDAVYCVRGRKVLPHKALEGKHKAGGHTVVAVPSAGDEVYTVPHARRGKCFGHTGVDSSLSLIHISQVHKGKRESEHDGEGVVQPVNVMEVCWRPGLDAVADHSACQSRKARCV